MRQFLTALALLLALSGASSATTRIMVLVRGASPPPVGCAGAIDNSAGCPLPMLGL